MKPPYEIEGMASIRAREEADGDARPVVISTFSGCGGSCLGYRMAGYRVAWASEFIPAAAETYRANASPRSVLDTRDVRKVQPEEILSAVSLRRGEVDLFDGSPPCASFSTAGKREKGWGKVKAYSDSEQRTDDLFFEYVRLLRGLQPRAFIAENVSGLVKGKAKGYFLEILRELKACGYRVEAKLLDASWLGVPQSRVRLIFQGVREDLGAVPVWPKPLPYRYSIREALPWALSVCVDRKTAGFGTGAGGYYRPSIDRPMDTVTANGAGADYRGDWGIVENDAWMTRHATGREWEKLKAGEQSEKYFQLVRPSLESPAPTVTAAGGNAGLASVTHPTECRKFSIAELRRICGFPDDFILTGSYQQQWERLGRAVPPPVSAAVAKGLLPILLAVRKEAR